MFPASNSLNFAGLVENELVKNKKRGGGKVPLPAFPLQPKTNVEISPKTF